MEVKHAVLHAVYLHFEDKQRKMTVCATNFTCSFLEYLVHAAVCVSLSSKSVCKPTYQQFIFNAFLKVWAFLGSCRV